MIRSSIRRQIMGIAVGLIVLMVAVSLFSMFLVHRGGTLLDRLTSEYIPAYGNLARANVHSLERAVALRNMMIDKARFPDDAARFDRHRDDFEQNGRAFETEASAALAHIKKLIEDDPNFASRISLAQLESRINAAIDVDRRHLNEEIARLMANFASGNGAAVADGLARIDTQRTELSNTIANIRADMLHLVQIDGATTIKNQNNVMLIVALLTLLAALLGLVFSVLISAGMTRPVRRLLEGTRAVEAGNLDNTVEVTSQDEIGDLTAAFNRMVEQLRQKERIRETFGRYMDPQVVEGLINRPEIAAADGQRRTMTVLFCDMKGFTNSSQQMTPQGLVKVMNLYFATMSEPIRQQFGIIDKYIGDAIMAYWGPPFNRDEDQARLACEAALQMIGRLDGLRRQLPELLGVRSLPVAFDVRIGVATGDTVVGSVGSQFMMSYTVMGDAVNLASRLESLNNFYGSHLLISEATVAAIDMEVREIDHVVVQGQTDPQRVFDIMSAKGALTPSQQMLRAHYAEGLAAYRQQRWDDAAEAFSAALAIDASDGPSKVLRDRVAQLKNSPPDKSWDGIWHFTNKS
ncbi:MAG: adenylate/guanylate cyclase domain-containing protein [Rhizobiales bacterium 62-47]|nr:adenylate/guanylate cyclase domain-containing protein [Hyphomicrobiales bacterium]OJY12773.1 MAG: adenylate/guanylate cyclase domain-containing protein [Rhizobiales bacterium 62-47]